MTIAQSCGEDDTCPVKECNTGVLNDETCNCDCPAGFSGDDCSTEDLCITNEVDCLNGGTCVDGTCECPDGYEGVDCSVLWNTKFSGNYINSEMCPDGTFENDAVITADPVEERKITIALNGGFSEVICDLLTSTTFDIPEQTVNTNGVTINGDGSIDDNGIITLNWNRTDVVVSCVFTLTPN